jgi:glycosyltransferase involved in cell wall biosynthesis
VVAIPSRRESFGRVTLEAMASGRPLVASRVGGLEEAITDFETGRLVPPEDPAALAEALRSLLLDLPSARRMGAAARQRYESRYTMDHMATSWREAWERAIARTQPAS